jgi:hypothetical protein
MLNLHKSESTSLWGPTALMGDVMNHEKHVCMKTKWQYVNKVMPIQHHSQQRLHIPY